MSLNEKYELIDLAINLRSPYTIFKDYQKSFTKQKLGSNWSYPFSLLFFEIIILQIKKIYFRPFFIWNIWYMYICILNIYDMLVTI